MLPKYFLIFCGIALVVSVAVSAATVEQPDESSELEVAAFEGAEVEGLEEYNPALAIAIRILTRAFTWAAKHCIEQAAHECKHLWQKPGELISCGGRWLAHNKGRCMIG